jgi:ankyrin repeat protein
VSALVANALLSNALTSAVKRWSQLLFRLGTDAHVKDPEGFTALHWAANCGRVKALHVLLEMGLDLHHVDKKGVPALHYAAGNGHPGAVQALLQV